MTTQFPEFKKQPLNTLRDLLVFKFSLAQRQVDTLCMSEKSLKAAMDIAILRRHEPQLADRFTALAMEYGDLDPSNKELLPMLSASVGLRGPLDAEMREKALGMISEYDDYWHPGHREPAAQPAGAVLDEPAEPAAVEKPVARSRRKLR